MATTRDEFDAEILEQLSIEAELLSKRNAIEVHRLKQANIVDTLEKAQLRRKKEIDSLDKIQAEHWKRYSKSRENAQKKQELLDAYHAVQATRNVKFDESQVAEQNMIPEKRKLAGITSQLDSIDAQEEQLENRKRNSKIQANRDKEEATAAAKAAAAAKATTDAAAAGVAAAAAAAAKQIEDDKKEKARLEKEDEERLNKLKIESQKKINKMNRSPIEEIANKFHPTDTDNEETNIKNAFPKAAFLKVGSAAAAVSAALIKLVGDIARAGFALANELGTSATQGVELEWKNRLKALGSVLNNLEDPNRIANRDEIAAVQKSAASAFVSVADGMEIDVVKTRGFAESLKGGFKSEFKLTSDALMGLAITGNTTEAGMREFLKSTGRASLSSEQFGRLVNKNTLSFLLYGNSFGKAAAEAEKLGISLSSVQAAQEQLVTNLDGTVDTVAQLNQLGSNIDFSTMIRISEQEGPDALMSYLEATVPSEFFKSASFRSLFNQLGISSEQLLRAGQVKGAVEELEGNLTTAGDGAAGFSAIATKAIKFTTALTSAFGAVTLAAAAAAIAMTRLAFMSALTPGGFAASIASGLIGGAIGSLANDATVAPGYGDRTLVTPTGNLAFNNSDTIMAGTKLGSKGSLQPAGADPQLLRKIESLIQVIGNASTTVMVGNERQTVNRMSLTGIRHRDDDNSNRA